MSGRRYTAGKGLVGHKGAKVPCRGNDWIESGRAAAYEDAALVEGSKAPKLPAKKPSKRERDASPEGRVSRATLEVANILCADGYLATWGSIRSATMLVFAVAFRQAYGMRMGHFEDALLVIDQDRMQRALAGARSVEPVTLDPEMFGRVHEALVSLQLMAGVVVPLTGKRANGAHHTPRSMTEPIVRKTLAPLFKLFPPERTLELRVCDPAVGSGEFLLELVRQLGARLVDGGVEPDILVAKRLVAIHCAYGVDICPYAVASAKIALWLECRADNMQEGWLDDNLKVGDALVGLLTDQMKSFDWRKERPEEPQIAALFDRAVAVGVERRQQRIQALAESARVA